MIHYHIRWAGSKLDWEAFRTKTKLWRKPNVLSIQARAMLLSYLMATANSARI